MGPREPRRSPSGPNGPASAVAGLRSRSASDLGRIAFRLLALALFLLGGAAALNALLFGAHHFLDTWVYYGSAQHLVHGRDVYDPAGIALPIKPSPLPFTYPPFAAMIFAGLFAVSFDTGLVALTVIGLAALFLSCVLAARNMQPDPRRAGVLAVAACGIGMAMEPVRETLSYGQINLVLLGLVAADCLVARPKWPRGMLIGIAAAIKLTPAAYVLYFLARRQWKQAGTALGTFAGCTLLAWLVDPSGSTAFWFHDVLDPSRVGPVGFVTNESLRGTIARTLPGALAGGVGGTVLWLGCSLLVVAAAFVTATRLRAIGENAAAWVVVAVAVTLISPISWSHHWVWIGVALGVAGYRAAQRRSAVGLLLVAGAVWVFWLGAHWQQFGVPPQTWSWWQHVKEEGYVLTAVAFLAAVTARPAWLFDPSRGGELPRLRSWATSLRAATARAATAQATAPATTSDDRPGRGDGNPDEPAAVPPARATGTNRPAGGSGSVAGAESGSIR